MEKAYDNRKSPKKSASFHSSSVDSKKSRKTARIMEQYLPPVSEMVI